MKTWFSIQNRRSDPAAEVLIFDEIGGFGIRAKDFAAALSAIAPEREIVVGLNSPGGDVFEGLAIYAILAQRRERVTVRIDGIAASIASILVAAGRRSVAHPAAFVFVHNPIGTAIWANADEMRQTAEALDKIGGQLASLYALKSGRPAAEFREAMDAETLWTADEAREHGLVDEITDAPAGPTRAQFDPRAYEYLARVKDRIPQANAEGEPQHNMHDIIQLLAEYNFLPAETPEAEAAEKVRAAIEALNAEHAQALDAQQTKVDEAIARAEKAEADAKRLHAERAQAVIQTAVQAGKIKPDAAKVWTDRLAEHPEDEQLLASIAEAPKPAITPAAAVPEALPAAPQAQSPDEIWAIANQITDPAAQRAYLEMTIKPRQSALPRSSVTI